ncbi:MAG: Asp-tRNA(Asn)/Glu-tRNA(Gln) amidotransferase subunit GatB [Chloroflexi bacterium]|nr:MAG: Asp-tRNA(Asn)/Glu-tRNA(Gln) amidotransferase subunit GatB [Chloroflexota bacterium]
MTTAYELVVGMEVHAQILTRSKMFCGCSTDAFNAAPNANTCPVCLAMPGMLPVINKEAVAHTIRAGLALNCRIAEEAVFARKNYNYPDLPKGYQISQYELPLCLDGWLEIDTPQGPKRIGITRAHLEEDTGKLIHAGDVSLVDLNRAGVPLLEIVSEPHLNSIEEVNEYLTRLRQILVYIGVNSGDLEKGHMRMEANLSLRPKGSRELGVKVEIKNLNSFRAVRNALEYEVRRQTALLQAGREVEQVTMGWLEHEGRTYVQRTKESAHDYRYFPEPDLPPLFIERAWVEELRRTLPELPLARRARFQRQYGLKQKEADVLVAERGIADYFETVVEELGSAMPANKVANWIIGDLFRLLNESGLTIDQIPLPPRRFAALLKMVADKTINANTASNVLKTMFRTGESAQEIVEREGLAQVSDAGVLAQAVERVLAEHPAEVERYRQGEDKLLGWFIGQVMRETRGKANPSIVRQVLVEKLSRSS